VPFVPAVLDLEVASLHHQYSAQLLTYGVSLAGSEDAASDALQEVFLRYFIERSHGGEICHPRAWLYCVLRNYLLDRLASTSSKREVATDDAVSIPDESTGPEDRIRHAQMADHLRSVLSPREMECLQLRADGLAYDGIAEVLGLRTGTVSAMLTRAHKKLRASWRESRDGSSGARKALHVLLGGCAP
jgi:RNA polymerase sigma-70 factor, ECF subfamily